MVNFAEGPEEVAIKIPEAAWQKMNISEESVVIGGNTINRKSTVHHDIPTDLALTIPPLDYQLIKIEKNL